MKIEPKMLPPIVMAMSNAADDASWNWPPGCTSWVVYETRMKITPPIRAIRRMARGTVLRGSIVSSVNVVTASKPRNEYAAMAAPAVTPWNVAVEFRNGPAENSPAAPWFATTDPIDRPTNTTMTSTWNAIRM